MWAVGIVRFWQRQNLLRLLAIAQLVGFLAFFPFAALETAKHGIKPDPGIHRGEV